MIGQRGGNLTAQQQQQQQQMTHVGLMNPQQQNQPQMNVYNQPQQPQQVQPLHQSQQAFTGQPNLNQQQYGGMMGGNMQSASRIQHKGVPQVIPNVVGGQQQMQMQQQQQAQQQQQNAGAPNLMQKLNEITAPGGDILSKGKELIFMKFGLGGK